jgi:hypothetical protein
MRLAAACLACLLAGCSLDADEPFVPRTEAILFLCEDSAATRRLAWLSPEGSLLLLDWAPARGSNAPLTSLSPALGAACWIGSADGTLTQVNASGGRLAEVQLAAFRPDVLCLGARRLLALDSAGRQMASVGLQRQETQVFALDYRPRRAAYLSGRFFIAADSSVKVYQEESLALLGEVRFSRPVHALYRGNAGQVFAYTCDSGCHESQIEYNSLQADLLAEVEKPISFTEARVSPWREAALGKEYTGRVGRVGKALGPGPFRGVESFEVDFLEGMIYYCNAADSLRSHHISTRQEKSLFAMPYRLISAYYFLAPDSQ